VGQVLDFASTLYFNVWFQSTKVVF
jgi:hypothetical protein